MANSPNLERISSIVVMVAAIVVAGAVGYRTFGPRVPGPGESRAPEQISAELWREAVDAGIYLDGSRAAPVTIVEFADLECPACRGYQPILEEVVHQHAAEVRLMYVPYPLPYHRFAMAAARGGECAADLGALPQWLHTLYDKQDSLGLKSWGGFARAAGIVDTTLISRCAQDPAPVPDIDLGLRTGRELGNIGTPTIVVEGLQYFSPPTKEDLVATIGRAIRTARRPAEEISLIGSVFDSVTSGPLRGATVTLLDPRGASISSVESDQGGTFTIHAPNGRYRLRVVLHGYRSFEGSRSAELRGALNPMVVYLSHDRS